MMRIHFYVTNILYRRIHFFINNFKHTIYFLYFSIHFRVLVRVFSVDIYFVTPFLPRGRACFKCHEKVNLSRYTYQSYSLLHMSYINSSLNGLQFSCFAPIHQNGMLYVSLLSNFYNSDGFYFDQ